MQNLVEMQGFTLTRLRAVVQSQIIEIENYYASQGKGIPVRVKQSLTEIGYNVNTSTMDVTEYLQAINRVVGFNIITKATYRWVTDKTPGWFCSIYFYYDWAPRSQTFFLPESSFDEHNISSKVITGDDVMEFIEAKVIQITRELNLTELDIKDIPVVALPGIKQR